MSQPSSSQLASGSTITQRIMGAGLLIVALVCLILPGLQYQQFKGSLQKQADSMGHSLVAQTLREIATPLREDDHLALAAVLRELTNNPYVAHAAVYSVENRTLAEAGRRPQHGSLNSLYSSPVSFEHNLVAQLQLHVDTRRLQKPLQAQLQLLALSAIGLLLLTVFLFYRIGRAISLPLIQLRRWLEDPRGAAPQQNRTDEIGQLARALDSQFSHPEPAPELEPAPLASPVPQPEQPFTQPIDQAEPQAPSFSFAEQLDSALANTAEEHSALPSQTAVLAVDLNLADPLYSLDESRQQALLERHANALDDIARHWEAQLLQQPDGGSLLLFHGDGNTPIEQALCAAELLRALAHSLQMDIADSRITLGIQLGLALGDLVLDLSQAGLLEQPAVSQALELSRYSRNLTLISEAVAEHDHTRHCASIRRIVKPAGAHCIERLLPPFANQLEERLQGMLMQME